jgi:hypothetical protein
MPTMRMKLIAFGAGMVALAIACGSESNDGAAPSGGDPVKDQTSSSGSSTPPSSDGTSGGTSSGASSGGNPDGSAEGGGDADGSADSGDAPEGGSTSGGSPDGGSSSGGPDGGSSSGGPDGGPDAGVNQGADVPTPICTAGSVLESESNDTEGTADAINFDHAYCGTIGLAGDVDYLTFTLPADAIGFAWRVSWLGPPPTLAITSEGVTAAGGEDPPFFPGKTYVVKVTRSNGGAFATQYVVTLGYRQ